MKELFKKPIIEVIEINNDEIISTSGDPLKGPGYGPDDVPVKDWPF